MKVKIFNVTENDLVQLREIAIKTFTETFADSNSEENMTQYLNDRFNLDILRREVNTKGTSFFVAVEDAKAVGYLKINTEEAQTELQDTNSLEIERIYICKDYQGKGAGNMLFQKALREAKERDKSYVWLGVWEHNRKAIDFYQKNGFEAFDKHIFKLGDDEQIDILMRVAVK